VIRAKNHKLAHDCELVAWMGGKVVEISCVRMEMEQYLSSDSVQIYF
jgi:hypothetical protein